MSRKHRTEAERKAAQARHDAMIAREDKRIYALIEQRRLELEAMTPEERAELTAEVFRIFGRRS